jgi:hypothetical protein
MKYDEPSDGERKKSLLVIDGETIRSVIWRPANGKRRGPKEATKKDARFEKKQRVAFSHVSCDRAGILRRRRLGALRTVPHLRFRKCTDPGGDV